MTYVYIQVVLATKLHNVSSYDRGNVNCMIACEAKLQCLAFSVSLVSCELE